MHSDTLLNLCELLDKGHLFSEWQLPEVVLTQFVSPDDEHDVLETCRELKIKINT
jgi:hypothetical protein